MLKIFLYVSNESICLVSNEQFTKIYNIDKNPNGMK